MWRLKDEQCSLPMTANNINDFMLTLDFVTYCSAYYFFMTRLHKIQKRQEGHLSQKTLFYLFYMIPILRDTCNIIRDIL